MPDKPPLMEQFRFKSKLKLCYDEADRLVITDLFGGNLSMLIQNSFTIAEERAIDDANVKEIKLTPSSL